VSCGCRRGRRPSSSGHVRVGWRLCLAINVDLDVNVNLDVNQLNNDVYGLQLLVVDSMVVKHICVIICTSAPVWAFHAAPVAAWVCPQGVFVCVAVLVTLALPCRRGATRCQQLGGWRMSRAERTARRDWSSTRSHAGRSRGG
jgi:hypothetical protein